MEDSVVMVVHVDDVRESVCVLAVEGYGEGAAHDADPAAEEDGITFRGERGWKDTVGGATVCCSCCCAALGFASLENSPETMRLLKHRLSASPPFEFSFQRQSCASFVAHELVRYAESKAIFTFLILKESDNTCLLLRLLSWDTRLADSIESTRDASGRENLHFRRVAKVIYEETAAKPKGGDGLDPLAWKWGGVDVCCLPAAMVPTDQAFNSNTTSTGSFGNASVRIVLTSDEWDDLKEALHSGSQMFLASEVVDATIALKLGTRGGSNAKIGLSALFLLGN